MVNRTSPDSRYETGSIPDTPNPSSGKGIPFQLAIDAGPVPEPFRGFVRDDQGTGYSTYQEYLNNTEPPYDTSEEFQPADIEITENDEVTFSPVYYPDRYTDTMEKEVNRDAKQCGGEDVTIDKMKNPEFHATGIVLAENVGDFRKIRSHKGPINLVTPMTDNLGGMQVVVTKAEIGEIIGWDAMYEQWQFSYTVDMVATGTDVDEGAGESQIVSDVIEDAGN